MKKPKNKTNDLAKLEAVWKMLLSGKKMVQYLNLD